MNKLVSFKYKDHDYLIGLEDKLETLLLREELIQLPMQQWYDLLILKDKICPIKTILAVLIAKVIWYDKSENVNSFTFNNKQYWWHKEHRLELRNLADYSTDTLDIILNTEIYNISVESLKDLLKQLEVYAGKCFINTQKHLNNIKSLKTLEEILKYDYTKGYPKKVIFNE